LCRLESADSKGTAFIRLRRHNGTINIHYQNTLTDKVQTELNKVWTIRSTRVAPLTAVINMLTYMLTAVWFVSLS
jgi:hypothetical protein